MKGHKQVMHLLSYLGIGNKEELLQKFVSKIEEDHYIYNSGIFGGP